MFLSIAQNPWTENFIQYSYASHPATRAWNGALPNSNTGANARDANTGVAKVNEMCDAQARGGERSCSVARLRERERERVRVRET